VCLLQEQGEVMKVKEREHAKCLWSKTPVWIFRVSFLLQRQHKLKIMIIGTWLHKLGVKETIEITFIQVSKVQNRQTFSIFSFPQNQF
jgi:hypothetical protein